MRVLLVLLVIALANSGCFALEEIEKGQEILATHSPDGPGSPGSKAEEEAAPKTPRERLAEYYAKQRAKAKDLMAKQPREEPSDAIGACKVGGRTHFTRRYDCELRGGIFL